MQNRRLERSISTLCGLKETSLRIFLVLTRRSFIQNFRNYLRHPRTACLSTSWADSTCKKFTEMKPIVKSCRRKISTQSWPWGCRDMVDFWAAEFSAQPQNISSCTPHIDTRCINKLRRSRTQWWQVQSTWKITYKNLGLILGWTQGNSSVNSW